MLPAIERTAAQHGRPTYYETLLALAFKYFADERVDVAVIEVGLGGRLDGTNVIVPRGCRDHVGWLRPHRRAGSDARSDCPRESRHRKTGRPARARARAAGGASGDRTLRRRGRRAGSCTCRTSCASNASEPRSAERSRSPSSRRAGRTGSAWPSQARFSARTPRPQWPCSSSSPTSCARAAKRSQRRSASVAIPGRMELFSGEPTVVFDIAHNAEKAASLVASLRERFPNRRVHYVVAIGESKDARRILEILGNVPSTFTFTSFTTSGPHERFARSGLRLLAESLGGWGRAITDPVEALTVARRMAAIDDVVVVTGSTFVVAGLREWYVPARLTVPSSVRGRVIRWGRSHVRHGHRQRNARFVFGRRSQDRGRRDRACRRHSGAPAPISWTSAANRRGRGISRSTKTSKSRASFPSSKRCASVFRTSPISVDTYKPAVARAAHAAGADIVNSVWGAPDALLDVACRAAHADRRDAQSDGHRLRGRRRGRGAALSRRMRAAEPLRAGSRARRSSWTRASASVRPPTKISPSCARWHRLVALGFPTMLGASRKSTIGKLTGREPADRVYGTVATTALAVQAGIDIVRVHDVAAARDALAVADAIVRDWRPAGWTG